MSRDETRVGRKCRFDTRASVLGRDGIGKGFTKSSYRHGLSTTPPHTHEVKVTAEWLCVLTPS
jgi:hypothetical protein